MPTQSKLIQALHSRTVWTVVVMVVYNVLAVFGKALSPDLSVLVNTILATLVSYFHLNPTTITMPAGTSVTSVTQTSPTTATVTTSSAPAIPTVTPTTPAS